MSQDRFARTHAQLLAERFGGRWEVERTGDPPPATGRELGRLAVQAQERALTDRNLPAPANERALEHRA